MPQRFSYQLTQDTANSIISELYLYGTLNSPFTVQLVSPYTVWRDMKVSTGLVALSDIHETKEGIFIQTWGPNNFPITLKFEDTVTITIQNNTMSIIIETKDGVDLCYVFVRKL